MGYTLDQLPPHIRKLVAQAGYTKGQSPGQIKRKGEPNELEKKFYQDVLAPMELAGEISDVQYEGERFPLAHACTYTPDYIARDKNGQKRAYEVKARHRHFDKGWQKAKFFATTYPNIDLYFCEVKKGKWSIKLVPALIKSAELPPIDEDDE